MNSEYTPKVSILIAARNERENIESCIDSLIALNYPKTHLEIWVGDDSSTDGTSEILDRIASQNPCVHAFRIVDRIGGLNGKANVLAQLAAKADGEFIFLTDADVTVSAKWVSGMIHYFNQDFDIITGATAVEGRSLFGKLQNADWLYNLANRNHISDAGKPFAASGNNMAIRVQAYNLIGGLESVSCSVTEDYDLFKAFMKNGFAFKSLLNKDVLAFTKPMPSLPMLLQQQKRWLTCAFKMPKILILGSIVQAMFLPLLFIIGAVFGTTLPLTIFFVKYSVDLIVLIKTYKRLGLKVDKGVFLFTPYACLINILCLLYYFLPIPIIWKGRAYYD